LAGAKEFGLLGPLAVRLDGVTVPLRRGSQRTLLAALLLAGNRVVSADAIAEALCGPTPPPSAPVAIRNYVSRLREALGEAGTERICTQPRGYLIPVSEDELNLDRFERLLASARAAESEGSRDAAAGRARAALALWRGEPLADIASEMLALHEVLGLADVRLRAVELRSTPACIWRPRRGGRRTAAPSRYASAAPARPAAAGGCTGAVGKPARWAPTGMSGRCWPRSSVPSLTLSWRNCTSASWPPTQPWTFPSPRAGPGQVQQAASHPGCRGSCPARWRISPGGRVSWRRWPGCWTAPVRRRRAR
jgi:hypothetical protein